MRRFFKFQFWDSWGGPFLAQGYNFNKLDRILLVDATDQTIEALGLVNSYKKNFFPIQAYVKHVTTWSGPFLAPAAQFEQTWLRSTSWCFIPNMKALGLVVSDKKVSSSFPLKSLCKTCDPEWGHLWSHKHNLNKLGKGPLDDGTLGQVVSEKIFIVFFSKNNF